jgi:RNA polymerase sigma-70 factor (ECF subfamily)
VLYRYLWDQDEVQDVMHEAFVKLWDMRSRVVWDTAKSLVYRMAINLAKNRLRYRKIRRIVSLEKREEDQVENDNPHLELEQKEMKYAFQKAMAALPEKQRRVLLLGLYAKEGDHEVAEILKIPPGTVASRKHKAHKKLKAMLSRWENKR